MIGLAFIILSYYKNNIQDSYIPMKLVEEAATDSLRSFWEAFRGEIILIGVACMILLGSIGFFSYSENAKQTQLRIVEDKPEDESISTLKTNFIHIAGSVENPDVYEMAQNARLRDVLEKANGLSIKADRTYFERNFNLAEVVSDGQKIYIPSLEEVEEGLVSDTKSAGVVRVVVASEGGMNINVASDAQLDTLPGVGAKTVQKIVENRPYTSIQELLDKKIVGQATFDKIKTKIVAE